MYKSYDEELQLLIDKVEGTNDMEWEELADELDVRMHPDSLRKSFNVGRYSGYQVAKYYQDKFENEYCTEEEIARLEELRDEVYKEKCKLADKKREYNKELREEARYENLLESIECYMADMPELVIKPCADRVGDKEACLLLSDVHYGALIDNTVNYYDVEIAKVRLQTLCSKVIAQCQSNNVGTLRIVLLGDLINGAIHLQSQVESEEDIMSQIMHVSELLANFITEVSANVNTVKLYGVYGNHSRMTKNKAESRIVENFERLIFEYITMRTGLCVYTNGLEDWLIFSIGDKKIYISHGDRDNVNNVRAHAINVSGEIPDYIYLAHIHHLEVKDSNGTEVIVNGSLMGTDSYAMSIRCNTKPYQIMHVFDGDDENIIKLTVNE